MKNKTVIFDLDGTLALIDQRREISTKENGKMDWDIFFDPKNIEFDLPNHSVIEMAKMLKEQGHSIVIFSGRSKVTKIATMEWLDRFGVPHDVLKMRPDNSEFKFMPDDKLKQHWLDQLFPVKDDIMCVFDDRDKVVKMWRDNGLTTFQVAEGNF
jgi:FMN phosphatase YigB (HAD superfamily)|tara:strand:+ start:3659 stop:4123 length:465 start_codon:yes stop_codon:yes gene_type:complete